MAKGNMLLGYSRGSVGDLTFYRRNAQQITRARARQVKNPKTLAQQMQRAIMRTAVGAYQVLKEICDHSFEGIAYGAESYSYFLKRNLAILRQLAAEGGENTKSYLPYGFNGVVAMPFLLSKGSLPSINVAAPVQGSSGTSFAFGGGLPSQTSIGTITYEALANVLGAQIGDQVTFVLLPKRHDIDESSAIAPIISRLILSSAEGDSDQYVFDDTGKVDAETENERNENMNVITFNIQANVLNANIPFSVEENTFIGGAIILSRRNADGSWLRSTASLKINNSERNGGYTLRQASMVAANEIQTPSDWYLNNANEIVTAD